MPASSALITRVHPRRCGGAIAMAPPAPRMNGPSPQVRGSRVPAPRAICSPRVHPRRCGGADLPIAKLPRAWGPSPQVRGSRDDRQHQLVRIGSIPAGAGEPTTGFSPCLPARVHPRRCGGAVVATAAASSTWGPSPQVRGAQRELYDARGERGPSPQVRGSRAQGRADGRGGGSIPAGAGEPSWTTAR